MNYLRMLQLRRLCNVMLAPDTGAGGGDGAGNGSGAQGGGEGGDGGNAGEGAQSGADGQTSEKTFTQADVDKILRQEQAKWKRQQEKAVTEAQRLANMTAEQRAQEEARQREADLTRREAELNRRELRAQALETLAAGQMPAELADLLDYTDADACSASIKKVEKNWKAAVQKGVEARLAGSPPKTGSGKSGAPKSMRDAISAYYNK
ncbi:MAG: DUF4355 domain-containing protein [Clostridia bacterium]|nr:DUF4355 domain-containing protein [Clostridia bacterium]